MAVRRNILKGTPVLGHAASRGAKFSADFCGNGLGDDFLDVFRLWKKILKAQFLSIQILSWGLGSSKKIAQSLQIKIEIVAKIDQMGHYCLFGGKIVKN